MTTGSMIRFASCPGIRPHPPLCFGIGLKSSATRRGGREPETRATAKTGAVLSILCREAT